ncbi:ATP-binding cassette domain-containing protein [Streptacidiphilus rugosus]|uniref:ATP-binding cassette domain-containing protein n=1 Tax=Streptacidiphilus rugosus TaxID=405783 RepID=UPI00068DCBBD|nr:ATP-binding cassette domain-containing protein [Streptacidiphilus rugosus]
MAQPQPAQWQSAQRQSEDGSSGRRLQQTYQPFQAIGLTRNARRGSRPTLLDLSFDARPGQVTALLGPEGSGRSTALRLALGIEQGQGTALFHGRPYKRLAHPEREVGVVLGDAGRPAGHPGRRARAHLRMMAAAAGVPARRADQLLEQTRLGPAAEHRLRTYSPGMTRRLQLAQALLGDPCTLVLDEPTEGLSPKNVEWFHAFLRAFAAGGGAVLVTLRSPQEAAVLADRVVTLELGRLLADQPVEEFRRTRLRDEVSVRGPQVARLADVLAAAGATVRREGGNVISVEGMARTEVGELAFRHGILLHELADHVVEHAPVPPQPSTSPPPSVGAQIPPTAGSDALPEGDTGAEATEPTSARATVSLGPGETITTRMVVSAEPAESPAARAEVGGSAAPSVAVGQARRDTRVSEPLFRDDPADGAS